MKPTYVLEVINVGEKTVLLKVLESFCGVLKSGEFFDGFYENVEIGDKIMVCDIDCDSTVRYFKIEEI